MTFYDGIYPFYNHDRKPSVFDVQCMIIIIVFVVFALTLFVILPGIRGRARISWACRILTSLFIGTVIVVVNFTSDWEVGSVSATTTYKSFSNAVVNAEIGLQVGLNGVNITLKGNPIQQINETINYNEEFVWSFGSDYNQYYNDGLKKGLPNPILYVAEKFTQFNPCGMLFQYRISGHYASACMWVAFCSWIVCNILFSMPSFIYGAYMILVTSAFMIFSIISFATVRNIEFCNIHFGAETLKMEFGASFWISLATGLLCFVVGTTLIVLNFCAPNKLKIFFNMIEEDEEEQQEEIYINKYTRDSMSKDVPEV
ncbi:hypothetical protein GDO86_006215 [Hymenochirus boettgeri]|uniref:Dual oxidase maturation factor 1-like n=1 Tax=Hymenochirus boettgeri TaxID=247094 RepID=A0A8T2J9H4_9PIPI|nr:hypothetical protein GDO86_006215 [Hymenochirus boettgeri]